MSELEALCENLSAINGDILRMARELHVKATAYNRAAAYAAQTARSAEGPEAASLGRAAGALDAAARHCGLAAQLLHAASVEGQAFVQRTVSGGSGVTTSSTPDGAGNQASTDLQRVYSDSFPLKHGAGRFFLAQGDQFRRVADTMPATKDGSYLAMIHGSPDAVGVGDMALDAHSLAFLIRSDPSYCQGQSVTLFSCSTGQAAGFAQQLADALDAPVTAPTSLAWLPPEADGSILITPMDPTTGGPVRDLHGKGLGAWRRFVPVRP